MPIQAFKDYVYLPKVWMLTDDGVFIGTQKYMLCIPSKVTHHSYNYITTERFSLKGKAVHEAVEEMISQCSSLNELEEVLYELEESFEGTVVRFYSLEDIRDFKVQAGFLGSGIHVRMEGKRGYTPFIQRLGKLKKEVKAFYANHPKLA